MKKRKGFTLIELMVVVLIVAILAAAAVPILRGRIDAAKWSEGKAMMGSIATAIRIYVVETNAGIDTEATTTPSTAPTMAQLGFKIDDLKGSYFERNCFTVESLTYDQTSGALDYTIQCVAATSTLAAKPTGTMTLNEDGLWGGP